MPFDIKTQLRVGYYASGSWVYIQDNSFEIDVDRGIQVEQSVFARPSVGTATVKMIKSSLADFMNGPQYQSNMPFKIEYQAPSTSWISLFTGFIQNIEMNYVASARSGASALDKGKLQVTITANDYTKLALGTQISTFNITSGTRSYIQMMNQLATAITAIDSRYVQTQALSGGSSTYQHAYTYLDISSGELYAQFLDAELGWLWSNRDGGMYFHTRSDVNTIQNQTWNSSDTTISNIHSTSANHVCMDNLQLTYDSDSISNVVAVTETFLGTKTTQSNSSSITAYGRQVGRFEVNFNPASPSSTLAQWASAVATAANPKSISQVSVPAILDSGEVSIIANTEIGGGLQVEFGQTGFTTLQEIYMVSRLNHIITADHWEMNIGLWRGI